MTCVLLLAAVSSGCGIWTDERYEQAVERIDARLTEGMSLGEFESAFPAARIIEADGPGRVYLVSEMDVCFVCKTRDGFRRSTDVFARAVRFEDGRLVSIEPAPEVYR